MQAEFTLTERALMRKGTAGTFGTVFDRHARAVSAWALEKTGDDELVADIVAETFATGWRRRRRAGASPDGSAYPWLVGIAQSLVDRWRSTSRVDSRSRVRIGMPMRVYSTPLESAGLVDIRADLVDAITATRQKRPWVWARHGASAAAFVLFVHGFFSLGR
jgi:DNA-directed RNA polymerase specialized sigma24 family protein